MMDSMTAGGGAGGAGGAGGGGRRGRDYSQFVFTTDADF
jgi:hypothetical protein